MLLRDQIWSEWWFQEYSSQTKLFYIYLTTNPNSTIYGIQRHTFKKVCFETELSREQIKSSIDEIGDVVSFIEESDKLFWSYVQNYFYHYSGKFRNNPQIRGFQTWFHSSKFPKELRDLLKKDFEEVLETEFLPNTIALSRKEVVAIRDRFKCVYCGKEFKSGSEIELDHLIPKSKGGTSSWDNLVSSCKTCNLEKLDLSIDDLEKYSPNSSYRKFEAIKDVKKPDVFTKFRKIFPFSDQLDIEIEEKPSSKDSKVVSLFDVICEVLSDQPNGLEISEIHKIIDEKGLYKNRKGETPDKMRMSVAIGRGENRDIKKDRIGKGYLYKLIQ